VGLASLSERRRRGAFSNLESHTKAVLFADVGGMAGTAWQPGPRRRHGESWDRGPARDEKTAGGSSVRSASRTAGAAPVAKSQRSHPPGLSDSRRRRRESESQPRAKR
jgi:hypothetical protein